MDSDFQQKSKGIRDSDLESLIRMLYEERLKICMLYSSIFPPDYEFDKDTMIQLWVAEGIFGLEQISASIEEVGGDTFDLMVATKLIVPSRFDMGYGQIQYKFNKNRFRDYYYAGRASVDDRLIVKESELGNISKEIKYLSLICKNFDDQTSEALKDFTGLRTLVLLCEPSSSITHVPRNVFLNLKHLVTLDLHQFNISELPSSIGNLVSLHYLDVSETPIKHLPESIGSLRRLETIKLKGCLELHHLNTTKLIFLRHLDLDIVGQLNQMPTGMGSLRSLRTLKAFLIGTEDGCRVQELLYLNELSGSFCISGLENISNSVEAQEAKLQDKQYLRKVELRWGGCHSDGPKVEDEILESLQPNSSIEELEILFFNGFRLPSWISDSSLHDIVSITLYKCKNCSRLPSLGTLPSLKYLELHQMTGITAIDHVFCRNYKVKGVMHF
ncbi:hypothetical protein ACH5RR_006922 [Cinchona calisaya]|uniref:Disease resistance RPP13-like protein 1 n=1 Tax=Cinchona calisaya TaxID=153742 RepID=A0ABD3AQC0_9GENT